jgi:hypothetical protein
MQWGFAGIEDKIRDIAFMMRIDVLSLKILFENDKNATLGLIAMQ